MTGKSQAHHLLDVAIEATEAKVDHEFTQDTATYNRTASDASEAVFNAHKSIDSLAKEERLQGMRDALEALEKASLPDLGADSEEYQQGAEAGLEEAFETVKALLEVCEGKADGL